MANRRTPDPRRAKLHRSYTVAEAAKLFGVHRNTVRNWIKRGLETIRAGGQTLILGHALRAYLEKARKRQKAKTPPGHLFCLRCRSPRAPAAGMMELAHVGLRTTNVRALCGCGAVMHRQVSLMGMEKAGFGALAADAVSRT